MESTEESPTLRSRDEERKLIEFRLPELGEGIESGQVIEVFVSPGDRVTLEQPLLEVETDKAAVEIPSPADGTIVDVCVSAGDTVEISQVLVRMNGTMRAGNPRRMLPPQKRKNPPRRKRLSLKKNPKKKRNRLRHPKARPQTISPRRDLSQWRRHLR